MDRLEFTATEWMQLTVGTAALSLWVLGGFWIGWLMYGDHSEKAN